MHSLVVGVRTWRRCGLDMGSSRVGRGKESLAKHPILGPGGGEPMLCLAHSAQGGSIITNPDNGLKHGGS